MEINRLKKYIHKLNIGNVEIKNNIFLAPMAGVTDLAFREIVRNYDVGLTFTEMASSKAMEFGSPKTEKLLSILEDERPSVAQIFGSDAVTIKNMVLKLNEDDTIDIIDINMGCPAPKLVKNGDGAGLLLDLDNVKNILETAVKASKKPITVKTRKGFNNDIITAVKLARIAEEAGVKMITVHGRTREEYYSGTCDLDIIKKVKESVSIPVIGNGDVMDLESAIRMFEYTGCDGIMIARGSLGNPWIFKSILEQKEYIPNNSEKLSVILNHIDLACKYDGERTSRLKLRKHLAWYLKGIDNGAKYRDMINKSESINEMKQIVKDALYDK
ncbi:MAG: tRNA dihydrouridine synthase DusB [Clostridia bacterium]|nr:tRNA dihydrouridine synthase DusB [Clostridia bacterium]MDD4386852.1 tRNA dihydrouridine synthase DusB [Clostridia bacterium]